MVSALLCVCYRSHIYNKHYQLDTKYACDTDSATQWSVHCFDWPINKKYYQSCTMYACNGDSARQQSVHSVKSHTAMNNKWPIY